ncbi:MAG: hypothetical protein JW913_07775 [Chitinispirillaceae bacterium]|nr:hypothetical protein [Chitinispirillaceae bacterium]
MLKYMLILCLFLIPYSISAEITVKKESEKIFVKSDNNRPSIYKISPRAFSESDASEKLRFLETQGFNPISRKETDKAIIYGNEITGQYFDYNIERSEYHYQNRKLLGLTDEDLADTGSIRSVADHYLEKLAGEECGYYRFTEKNCIWMTAVNEEPRLFTVSYRYVRVLDGRDVRGVTSRIKIEIGQNRKIKYFSIISPKLEKVGKIDKKMKNSAMKKYLKEYIKSEKYTKRWDGVNIPIKSTCVKRGWESYFSDDEKYLEPCMSFFNIDTLDNGLTKGREIHIPVDVAKIPNTNEEDVFEYERHAK